MSALCWKTESGDRFGKSAMGDEIGADGFRLISQLSLALDFLWRPVGNSNQRLVHCAFFAPYARARTREVTRAVSMGRAYRQPVRAGRKAAVGIDVTSSTAPLSERLPARTLLRAITYLTQ